MEAITNDTGHLCCDKNTSPCTSTSTKEMIRMYIGLVKQGTALVQPWYSAGTALVQAWYRPDTALVKWGLIEYYSRLYPKHLAFLVLKHICKVLACFDDTLVTPPSPLHSPPPYHPSTLTCGCCLPTAVRRSWISFLTRRQEESMRAMSCGMT